MGEAWTLPPVPPEEEIDALLGELVEEISKENRRCDGGFSFSYFNGKWIELSFWDGTKKEELLKKDTRVSVGVIQSAIEAVRNI